VIPMSDLGRYAEDLNDALIFVLAIHPVLLYQHFRFGFEQAVLMHLAYITFGAWKIQSRVNHE